MTTQLMKITNVIIPPQNTTTIAMLNITTQPIETVTEATTGGSSS